MFSISYLFGGYYEVCGFAFVWLLYCVVVFGGLFVWFALGVWVSLGWLFWW